MISDQCDTGLSDWHQHGIHSFERKPYSFPSNKNVNEAKEIGDGTDCLSYENHPSIQAIRANVSLPEGEFNFSAVSEGKESKYLDRIGLRNPTPHKTCYQQAHHKLC